jgi:hypothetical protein
MIGAGAWKIHVWGQAEDASGSAGTGQTLDCSAAGKQQEQMQADPGTDTNGTDCYSTSVDLHPTPVMQTADNLFLWSIAAGPLLAIGVVLVMSILSSFRPRRRVPAVVV